MKSQSMRGLNRRRSTRATFAISLIAAAVLAQGATPLAAQAEAGLPRPYDVMKKGVAENNYFGPLLELKSHEAQYLTSDREREAYLEYMTLLQSFVGDYAEAYTYEDRLLSTFPDVVKMREMYVKDLTTSPLDGDRPRDAVEAIAAAAGERQVVMISMRRGSAISLPRRSSKRTPT